MQFKLFSERDISFGVLHSTRVDVNDRSEDHEEQR